MDHVEELLRTHGAALHSYATRLTAGDHHAAEDVVQETWVRAWHNIERLTEHHGSVRGWLMRVAHNIAVDQHRARRARPAEVTLPEQDLDHVTTSSAEDEVEVRLVVGDLLGGLSPVHRDALVAVYYADRTANAAAGVLGVPPGTVKSRIHNALRNLRATITAPPCEPAVSH